MFQVDNLRKLVRSTGFIHILPNIILNESIFYSKDQIKKRNRFDLISFNEVTLLLSLLSEAPLDLSFPNSDEAERQYKECKAALDTLHDEISSYSAGEEIETAFTEGRHFVEPIFYSAGSGFWFDYLALAPRLYHLDKPFLEKEGYEIDKFSALLHEMQTTFKNRLRDFIREQRKSIRKFGTITSPLPCFIFSPSDVSIERRETYIKFIDRFSVEFGKGPTVSDPLDYHPCRARPALRISETQIFSPLVPLLCEQLYESPFYKIVEDKAYFLANANNRGMASELMLSEVLEGIQHLDLLRDVKLRKADKDVAQIDVAGVFGPTAIIFEIKTKRLTQASKTGNTRNLIADIEAGILEAQQQLNNSKSSLLSKTYDSISSKTGDVNKLSQASQVICVSVMTHEIPAYPLLIRTILEKARVADIVPISIFDLRIATAYLNNAFDFIYYFATRSILDRHLMYGTEAALLAFHLTNRLTIPDHVDQVLVDDSIGQNIDADYPSREKKLSLKFGVKIVDEILEEIIRTGDAALFRLFSVLRGMSGGSAKDAGVFLRKIEKMLRGDGKAHDATMTFGDVALTFIVANGPSAARSRLDALMQKRDREKNDYTQQYMLVLSPRARRPSGVSRSENSGHHFDVRAIAMKQNKSNNNGILAFSPRISEDHWQVREEGD